MANPSVSDISVQVSGSVGTEPSVREDSEREGEAVDRLGYSCCLLMAQTGDATGEPVAIQADFTIQDSDDGSTGWAEFRDFPRAGNYLPSTVSLVAGNASGTLALDLGGAKRYLRVLETVAFIPAEGEDPETPTVVCASQIALGGKVVKP